MSETLETDGFGVLMREADGTVTVLVEPVRT